MSPRRGLPRRRVVPHGYLTTPQVLTRTGLTWRRLQYAKVNTTLDDLPFAEKKQWIEWPENIVRKVEAAAAIDRAMSIPGTHGKRSHLPTILQAVLDNEDEVPDRGWVLYDGKIRYSPATALDVLDHEGVLARIPAPGDLSTEPKPDPTRGGWAIISEGTS